MRSRIRDLPVLLRTLVGRETVWNGVLHRSWPLTSPFASAIRRTVGRSAVGIAVVGSYGKSTTTYYINAVLGNSEGWLEHDNHKAAVLQRIFGLRPADRYLLLEIGIDDFGQMASMARVIRPEITVVTSIGSEHHRSLRSVENTRAEKAQMVRCLRSDGLAVLNGDDDNVRWMAKLTDARIITYGFGKDNDVRASAAEIDWPHGTRFSVHANGKTRRLRIGVLGRHMVYAALAAVAVALTQGHDLDECLARLEDLPGVPGRMEIRPLPGGGVLVCDYFKSSYETVLVALDAMAELPARRVMVVLGEISEPPGSQGPIYRDIGERIAKVASRAVILGHNFQRYRAGALRAGMARDSLIDARHDVVEAARLVERLVEPGDVVLIKGRDTQRLDRVVLALEGRRIGCEIRFCRLKHRRCADCPMLEPGWNGIEPVT